VLFYIELAQEYRTFDFSVGQLIPNEKLLEKENRRLQIKTVENSILY
jgi:hypothetical protein